MQRTAAGRIRSASKWLRNQRANEPHGFMNVATNDNDHIDAAALAGAVLAGVLASMVPDGPFQLMNVPLGLTVLALLIAYIGKRERTVGKTIAFSAVVAYSSLLLFGFLFEKY